MPRKAPIDRYDTGGAAPDKEPIMSNDPNPDDPTRDEMLSLLEDGIREAHRKVDSGRVYDKENEKVRIQWLRCLAYSVNMYRKILRDKEVEANAERIAELEEQQGGSDYQLK